MNELSTNILIKYPLRATFYYIQTSTWQRSIIQPKDGACILQHFYDLIKSLIYYGGTRFTIESRFVGCIDRGKCNQR